VKKDDPKSEADKDLPDLRKPKAQAGPLPNTPGNEPEKKPVEEPKEPEKPASPPKPSVDVLSITGKTASMHFSNISERDASELMSQSAKGD